MLLKASRLAALPPPVLLPADCRSAPQLPTSASQRHPIWHTGAPGLGRKGQPMVRGPPPGLPPAAPAVRGAPPPAAVSHGPRDAEGRRGLAPQSPWRQQPAALPPPAARRQAAAPPAGQRWAPLLLAPCLLAALAHPARRLAVLPAARRPPMPSACHQHLQASKRARGGRRGACQRVGSKAHQVCCSSSGSGLATTGCNTGLHPA